jgi:nickel-dependent lactate racemase
MASFARTSGETLSISSEDKHALLAEALRKIDRPLRKVLIVPPDHTRLNSNAGELTAILYDLLGADCEIDIMPALGTHAPMTDAQIAMMFGRDIPADRFLVHDWRHDVVTKGEIAGDRLRDWSEGKLDAPVEVAVNKVLWNGYDLILSVGQIVPHEVVGMANYTKNIVVGLGGSDIINKSHFLGAVYGMERIMGRIDTPVRRLLNAAAEAFLGDLPIVYVMTVMSKDADTGKMAMRGLFVGDDMQSYVAAAELSQKVNLDLLDAPLRKVVCYLDPDEFRSTWLGNKAIYRTRMAIADGGELIVLAPALTDFGEDPGNDKVIRKYGYRGTPATLKAVEENEDIHDSLGAAAHLIHGSSEGRFRIVYCPGPNMTREEIESVGYHSGDLGEMRARYDPDKLKDGFNTLPDGEVVFFVSNPALGLWALKRHFETQATGPGADGRPSD